MKKTRNAKGITLIALVITIIILLILAGITLNILLGEGGIIQQTEQAEEQTDKASLKEDIYFAISSTKIGEELKGNTTLKHELEKIVDATVTNLELKEGEEGQTEAYYVERNEQGYTVYKDGSIEEGKTDFWDGTTEKPETDENKNWHIYTAEQMKYFAEYINNFTEEEKIASGMPEIESTTTVYLENNLDMGARHENQELKTGEKWTPIENFIGIFEGNNHSIRGIYVNEASGEVGIFGQARTINNLTVKNCCIITTNGLFTGGIAGIASNIENCHNEAGIIIGGESSCTGGIVGLSVGKFKNCSSSATVKGSSMMIGGIIRWLCWL